MQLTQLSSKSKFFVLLAASVFTLAAVGAKAQRALDLKLECDRTVDLCSTDSTFILTCSVGSLVAADSVLLYDIRLGFPADKVSFRQVLFTNTLSEGLENKDYNAKTSGEIRVYGFNLFKPIVGSKVLFAVQFKLKASCTDSTTIDFAALPELNAEAKVYINSLSKVVVPATIVDSRSRSLNFNFSNDTIVFTKFDQTQSFECRAQVPAEASLQFVDIALEYNTLHFRLNKLEAVNTTDSVLFDTTQIPHRVHLRRIDGSMLGQNFGFRAEMLAVDSSVKQQSLLMARLLGKSSCACVTRDTADSVVVITNISTSTSQNVSNTDYVLRSDGDVWELRNMTESSVELYVYTLLGALVLQEQIEATTSMAIDRSKLPKGPCFIRLQSPQGRFIQHLKFN